jgi:uncharacterized protein (DUF433 family)
MDYAEIMLRAGEAAVAAGIALRDVNRAVDERILPAGSFSVVGGRYFSTGACVIMAFNDASSGALSIEGRRRIIRQVEPRLRAIGRDIAPSLLREDWQIRDDFLSVDFAPFLHATAARLEQLEAARAIVMRSPAILGGTPVIRGTRVPLYDVAACVMNGYDRREILEAYPSITDTQIDLAVLYAEANPLRGRPRAPLVLPEGTVMTERRVPRRLTGG